MYRLIIKKVKQIIQFRENVYTCMHKYILFTNITNNIFFNSHSMLENSLGSDLLINLGYPMVPIILEIEAWKDIESYLLFMSLDCFMHSISFITIYSNTH